MGEGGGGEEKKRRIVVESLGWLTESTILPSKRKAIEGIGASSIVELKAQLYKSQEDAKNFKDLSASDAVYHRAKQRVKPRPESFSRKNSGVESRALKDKLELKAINDGSISYVALERKAALYDKLVKGELSDEEDKEKYCVDFFRKGVELEEGQQPQSQDVSTTALTEGEIHESGDSIFSTSFVGPGRTAGAMDRDEHKRFVREVHEKVNQAREQVSELKLRRQEQAEAKRERLKQAYLRKKLEQLKAMSGSAQT